MSDTVQLKVSGMTCGGCENAVKRALGKVPGVERVTASHQAGEVGVTFDPTNVSREVLRERIEALGYHVTP